MTNPLHDPTSAGRVAASAHFRSRPSVLLQVLSAGLLCGLVACVSDTKPTSGEVDVPDAFMTDADRDFVRSAFADQARAGTIRSRALYDYHFEAESSRLTPVGDRVVAVIASTGNGRLSVQRGTVSVELYTARIGAVRAALAAGGVPSERIVVTDAGAGGRGVDSVRAIEIRSEIRSSGLQVPTGEVLDNGGGSE